VIDRIRLTAAAKIQLGTIKRRTGIEHYNVICRHAFCVSLANPTTPPEEDFTFSGGLEIDWRTFTGGNETLYLNLMIQRHLTDSLIIAPEPLRQGITSHVHRGLSYLAGRNDSELGMSLSKFISDSD
jgi:DNA sulfur modification protein DndE